MVWEDGWIEGMKFDHDYISPNFINTAKGLTQLQLTEFFYMNFIILGQKVKYQDCFLLLCTNKIYI